MAMQNRLRAKGVPVVGPKDHGFCKSIYFAGPENLSLELSYSTEPINAEAWIDPEVVDLAVGRIESTPRVRSARS